MDEASEKSLGQESPSASREPRQEAESLFTRFHSDKEVSIKEWREWEIDLNHFFKEQFLDIVVGDKGNSGLAKILLSSFFSAGMGQVFLILLRFPIEWCAQGGDLDNKLISVLDSLFEKLDGVGSLALGVALALAFWPIYHTLSMRVGERVKQGLLPGKERKTSRESEDLSPRAVLRFVLTPILCINALALVGGGSITLDAAKPAMSVVWSVMLLVFFSVLVTAQSYPCIGRPKSISGARARLFGTIVLLVLFACIEWTVLSRTGLVSGQGLVVSLLTIVACVTILVLLIGAVFSIDGAADVLDGLFPPRREVTSSNLPEQSISEWACRELAIRAAIILITVFYLEYTAIILLQIHL